MEHYFNKFIFTPGGAFTTLTEPTYLKVAENWLRYQLHTYSGTTNFSSGERFTFAACKVCAASII